MLDANPSGLTELGTMTINEGRIAIEGFEAEDATCRDVVALALVWALGQLQAELMLTLEGPGRNHVCVN